MASKRKTPSSTSKSKKDTVVTRPLAPTVVKQEMTIYPLAKLQQFCGAGKTATLSVESEDGKASPLTAMILFDPPTRALVTLSDLKALDRIVLIAGKERRTFGELFRSEELHHNTAQRILDNFAISFFSSLSAQGLKLPRRTEPEEDPNRSIPAVGRVITYEYDGVFDFRVTHVDGWKDVSIGLLSA